MLPSVTEYGVKACDGLGLCVCVCVCVLVSAMEVGGGADCVIRC